MRRAARVVQSLLEVSLGAAVADQQLKDNYRRLQKRYHPVQTQPSCCVRHLESRAKASARLSLEVSVGWASPSSRGLWGGDALLLFTGAVGNRDP